MVAFLIAATTPVVALPSYEPNDAFIYTGGKVERVRQIDGDFVIWSGRGKASWRRSRNPIIPILEWKFMASEGQRSVGGKPDSLWPLRAGHSIRFRVVTDVRRDKRHARSVALWACSVGAMKPVTVPAGIFDAFPILCDRYSAKSMRLAERIITDWAPDVGHYVRRRSTLYASGETTETQLVATLRGDGATMMRIDAIADHAPSN